MRSGTSARARLALCVGLFFATSNVVGTELSVDVCARTILERHIASILRKENTPENLRQYVHVEPAELQGIEVLPVDVYTAVWTLERPSTRAWFTVGPGGCDLIAGDFGELLGMQIPYDDQAAIALSAYNRALEHGRGVTLRSRDEKIRYAVAVKSLTVPAVSLVLLDASNKLAEIAANKSISCKAASGVAKDVRRAVRQALTELKAPTVNDGEGLSMVTFWTWQEFGGALKKHVVYIWDDGRVAIESTIVALHVGAHRDVVYTF